MSTAPVEDSTSEKADVNELHAKLSVPVSRVKKIIRADAEIKGISLEALQGIARASELFLSSVIDDTYKITASSKRKTVTYNDFASVIQRNEALAFLEDIVPEKAAVPKKRKTSEASSSTPKSKKVAVAAEKGSTEKTKKDILTVEKDESGKESAA